MSPRIKGMALSAAGMAVLSPDALFIRMAGDVGVFDMLAVRSSLLGLSLCLFLALVYRQRFFGLWRGLGWTGWGAALLMAYGNFAFVGAVQNTVAANALVLIATMPFFAALIGWALIREAVAPRTLVAITVALCGVAVLVSGSLGGVGDGLPRAEMDRAQGYEPRRRARSDPRGDPPP